MSKELNNPKLRELVKNKYNGKCAYCGCELIKLHIDHIVPLKRWLHPRHNILNPESKIKKGENKIENYNPSCASCNSSKGSQDIEQFRNQLNKRHDYMLKYYSEYRSMVKFDRVFVNKQPVVFYFETL